MNSFIKIRAAQRTKSTSVWELNVIYLPHIFKIVV